MMSRSSARDSYVVKRPLMTITCCRTAGNSDDAISTFDITSTLDPEVDEEEEEEEGDGEDQPAGEVPLTINCSTDDSSFSNNCPTSHTQHCASPIRVGNHPPTTHSGRTSTLQ